MVLRHSSFCPPPSGSGSRGARIHTSCAVVAAPTLDRAFARWRFTVECDSPRLWAAAFSYTATAATTLTSRPAWRARRGAYEPGDGEGAEPKVHAWLAGKSAFSLTSSSGRSVIREEHSPRGAPATPPLNGASQAVTE